MKVSLEQVSKRFGPVTVVQDMSFEVGDGELFFLLGPSGCGKTTVLRMLAGFYFPDAGVIRFGEKIVNDVPPNKRNTGMVFQNYALWPHMTVFENVAYGLDVRRVSGEEKNRRVREALGVVQMAPFAARTPNQLSGGQQQRIALARALVVKPDVLLLDEPLSNLDAALRLEMREEIKRIHAETGITTIYVTHDQEEALSLADRIAVMREGRLEQAGSPRDLYRAPAGRFVAGFMGEANFIEGVVQDVSASQVRVKTAEGELICANNGCAPATGQPVVCMVRPESLWLAGDPPANRFDGVIESVSYLGKVEQYTLRLAQGALWKGLERNPEAVHEPGQTLSVLVKPQDVVLLPP